MRFRAYRSPSIKSLIEDVHLSKEVATEVKEVLTGKKDLMSYEPVKTYYNSCYNAPEKEYLALMACDIIMEGDGVEYIPSKQDDCYESKGVEYVNFGDTYRSTLLFDHKSCCFRTGSWGDMVETYPWRFE